MTPGNTFRNHHPAGVFEGLNTPRHEREREHAEQLSVSVPAGNPGLIMIVILPANFHLPCRDDPGIVSHFRQFRFGNLSQRAANLCPPVGIPVGLNRDPVNVVNILVVRVCLPLFYQKSINKYGGGESHCQPDRVDHEIAFPLKNLTSYQFEMIHIVLFLAVLQSTKNHLKISRSLSPNISYPDVMIFSPG